MPTQTKFKSFMKVFKYVLFDCLTIIISYLLTMWMFIYTGIDHTYDGLILALAIIIPVKLLLNYIFGIYKIISNHTGFEDFIRIAGIVVFTNILIAIYIFVTKADFMFESALVFITLIEISGMIGPRVIRRIYLTLQHQLRWFKTIGARTLIIGAGSAGEIVAKEIYKNKDLNNIPVCFVDDNPDKIGKRILGINIVGTLSDIDDVVKKYKIEEAILAIKDLEKNRFHELVNSLMKQHIKIRKLNILEDIEENEKPKLIDLKVEDLLDRPVIELYNQGIHDFIENEVVLVTGGGGSIGSELSRQIFDLKPKQLIIFDIYENNAYDIQMELLRKAHKQTDHKFPELVVRIGSVYNKERLEEIFKEFKPTIVFHAAAYKHIPLMEDSSVEAVRTNVLGTYNTATLSTKYKVKKFVLVSSDKAVRSTNVMGATKRFAELIIKHEQTKSETSFSAVRFGNVLGSNGSVIPLFKKQIADGGPVTVTHKDITRYFMTIPEAVGLILQCGVYAKKGDLFILDMGEPVKIYDLATKMIRLAGLRVGEDIEIEIVGLRPGEKLYEELLVDVKDKDLHKTNNQSIFVEHRVDDTLNDVLFKELIETFHTMDNHQIKEHVAKIVQSYKITN